MKKLVSSTLTILTVISVTFAEPPPVPSPYGRAVSPQQFRRDRQSDDSNIVDQRLLDRVADIFSQDGDGSEDSQGRQEMEGYDLVNSELLERIARIIAQNEGQTSPAAVPPLPQGPAITPEYGVPSDLSAKLVGTAAGAHDIGKPILARRIASFDITEGGGNFGGYSLGGQGQYQPQYQHQQSGSRSRSGSGRRIMYITSPQLADRIAAFEIPEANEPLKVNSGY